jgi:Na+/phosphate symporter
MEDKAETMTTDETTNIQKQSSMNIIDILSSVSDIYERTINSFEKEKRKKLKKTYSDQKAISKKSKKLKDNVFATVESLKEDSIESAPYYVQVLDYLREITHALHFIVKPTFDHLNNNHKPFNEIQFSELHTLSKKLMKLMNGIIDSVKKEDFEDLDTITDVQSDLLKFIDLLRKNQVKRIKNKEVGTKNSLLFMNLLAESKNISLYVVNLYKAQRDFILEHGTKE